jgi:MFS family permease
MLISAPGSTFLVLAGILQGFYYIGIPIAAAIERELVPAEHMGRWTGINRFFKMIFSAISALTAGIIWDKFGPQYIFITFIGIEILIRLPLLMSISETLNNRFKVKDEVVFSS